MKIVISGGGIGGLTAALCCLHHGHKAVVLEQAPQLGEVGAGIQLPPNAMKVFEAIGLDEAFNAYAFRPEAIEARMGISGMKLFSIELAKTARERWGSPYLHIHRADYIRVLEKALADRGADIVRFGQEVTGYEQCSESVSVTLANGSHIEGDVLIGADGIHSAVRTQMLGKQEPVFTGNVAWRTVVPIERLGRDVPPPTSCGWFGRGKHCVTYRLRGGKLANLVAVIEREDWTIESWTEKGTIDEALADFFGWHPIITRIIKESDTLYKWALFDRQPLDTWVDGRASLLGDAAHPTLPFMAQGAAMAVEDAWVIAHRLATVSSIDDALRSYQSARFERTSNVQSGSRANAKTFHQRTSLGRLVNYAPMWLAGKIATGAIYSQFDTLHGFDVTSV